MTVADPKAALPQYLQAAREALLWKLAGLSDFRHPPPADADRHQPAWSEDDARNNADMWATADESRDQIVGMYRPAWAHADETIETLGLDALGYVPWWPSDRSAVSVHLVMVHVLAETTGTQAMPISSASSSTGRRAGG